MKNTTVNISASHPPKPTRIKKVNPRTLLPQIILCAVLYVVTGCAPGNHAPCLNDLQTIPQNATLISQGYVFASPSALDDPQQRALKYLKNFFAPWHVGGSTMYPKEKLLGATVQYSHKHLVGENLQPWLPGRLDALIAHCALSSFPNNDLRAITVRDTNLRALPTNHPAFYPFDRPGEGYPFDYMQYSAVWAGTPLHICQHTTNNEWVLVEAGFVYGWMPVNDLALVDDFFVSEFQSTSFMTPKKDCVPLRDTEGIYRFSTHIGALYPTTSDSQGRKKLLLPVADASRHAVLVRADPPETVTPFPLSLTRTNQTALAQELLGQVYGWGGMYANRDCSAMTRDFMSGFAIWLPRNSSQQAKEGQRFEFTGMSSVEKKEIIRTQGVPFRTLIWMPGHVTLYLGQYQGRAVILHNTWGLKTKTWSGKEGRYVIGRTVITSLEPGAELGNLDRPKGLLINKITGMSILP